jgi:hypothetical protein
MQILIRPSCQPGGSSCRLPCLFFEAPILSATFGTVGRLSCEPDFCYAEDGTRISAAGKFKPPSGAFFIVLNNVLTRLKKGKMELDRQVLAFSCMPVAVPSGQQGHTALTT